LSRARCLEEIFVILNTSRALKILIRGGAGGAEVVVTRSSELELSPRWLASSTVGSIIKKLRPIAQDCKQASRDSPDEELAEYLQEVSVILTSIASVLEEYDQ
jgi:hypothetical protein